MAASAEAMRLSTKRSEGRRKVYSKWWRANSAPGRGCVFRFGLCRRPVLTSPSRKKRLQGQGMQDGLGDSF